MEPKPAEYYIANCIELVLIEDCSPQNATMRARYIAHAVTLAANEGEHVAWGYLFELCNKAKEGLFLTDDDRKIRALIGG